jgi:non-heme chloroperoxidase
MQRHGEDLGDFITALDLQDAVLVGGSMGGNTIWSYIGQYGTARLSGVVIVDQTPKMINTDDWPHGFYDYTEANRDTTFATAVPNPGRHSLASKGPLRIVRILRALRLGEKQPAHLSDHELELLNDHAKADWRPTIASTTVPIRFIAAEQSELWPSSHAVASASLAARATSVVIQRDGHAANIEQPGPFNRELLAFLAALPSPS